MWNTSLGVGTSILTMPSTKAICNDPSDTITDTTTSPGIVKVALPGTISRVGGLVALKYSCISWLGYLAYSWGRGIT